MAKTKTSWKEGESGNLDGRTKDHVLTKALNKALSEYVEVKTDKEEAPKKIKRIAQLTGALLDQAAKGNIQAMQLVFDRVEGKVKSEVDVTTAGQPLTFQSEALSDFASFLAGSIAGEADSPASDVGSDGSVLSDPVRSGETRH